MKRMWTLFLAGLYAIGLTGLSQVGAAPSAEPATAKNIVFILVDDLGWTDLACYGSDFHSTPRIDEFVSGSVKFTQAYSQSVCSPTRASILTGRHAARLHMTVWREKAAHPEMNRPLIPPIAVGDLPREEITLAEVLKTAGYRTAMVGKWHLGTAPFYPETQGFDINVGGTLWGAPATFFYPYRTERVPSAGDELRYVPHLEPGHPGEYLTDRLTDKALEFIEASKDEKFFLYLAYHTVHMPIEGKQEFVRYFEQKLTLGLRHKNPPYAAMVKSLDENVGRVLDRLSDLGLSENTIVVLTSDNGGVVHQYKKVTVTDNSPLRSGKGSLYEGGVRVPLVVRWPGVTPPGAVCEEPVMCIDYLPTLLEAVGVSNKLPAGTVLDGISLAGLLKTPSAKLSRDALFFHFPHYHAVTGPVSAIRVGDWKMVQDLEDGSLELFDLAGDPGERDDLISKRPDKAAELLSRLDRWRLEVDAQMPAVNPEYRKR